MNKALVIIDVQVDFCPGGALAVNKGDEITEPINAMIDGFDTIILTQDWHPANHASFAQNQPGKELFETIDMPYGPQTLWPTHCVQGTNGAAFHPDLRIDPAHLIIRKGYRQEIDSYSAFFENDRITSTGLDGYLKSRNIEELVLVGLATDFCVAYSALDAAKLGLITKVALSACRAINLDGSLDIQMKVMKDAGVEFT